MTLRILVISFSIIMLARCSENSTHTVDSKVGIKVLIDSLDSNPQNFEEQILESNIELKITEPASESEIFFKKSCLSYKIKDFNPIQDLDLLKIGEDDFGFPKYKLTSKSSLPSFLKWEYPSRKLKDNSPAFLTGYGGVYTEKDYCISVFNIEVSNESHETIIINTVIEIYDKDAKKLGSSIVLPYNMESAPAITSDGKYIAWNFGGFINEDFEKLISAGTSIYNVNEEKEVFRELIDNSDEFLFPVSLIGCNDIILIKKKYHNFFKVDSIQYKVFNFTDNFKWDTIVPVEFVKDKEFVCNGFQIRDTDSILHFRIN
ncbi:MAG: hypothetical protein R2769_01850 [Saprospiraceae bacterium]